MLGHTSIERAYRYLAEGDIDGAMNEIHREYGCAYGLPVPHLEKRRMAMIARDNAKEAA